MSAIGLDSRFAKSGMRRYLSEVSERIGNILAANLERVKASVQAACHRAGRARNEVTLVAVTKTVSAEIAAALVELGVSDFGESRPQELWRKAATLPSHVRWHMIGHLQRNKIERTLPLVHLIHSVDSVRLIDSLETQSAKLNRHADLLIELNLSREEQKSGMPTTELPALILALQNLKHVRVRGLMTMAALSDDPELSRPVFAELRSLRDRMRSEVGEPHTLEHLSMGMSQDYAVAIEEGATLIRVGSALFAGIE
jgi:pyridoxal phosphate enzyme (YggS family)